FFCSSRRRHTRCLSDWSSDVCSSDLDGVQRLTGAASLDAGPTVVKDRGSAATPIDDIEVIVPLAEFVDLVAERARLEKEAEKVEIGRASCRERGRGERGVEPTAIGGG